MRLAVGPLYTILYIPPVSLFNWLHATTYVYPGPVESRMQKKEMPCVMGMLLLFCFHLSLGHRDLYADADNGDGEGGWRGIVFSRVHFVPASNQLRIRIQYEPHHLRKGKDARAGRAST